MKKAISLILAFALLLSLYGCGQAETTPAEAPAGTAAPSETAVPETTAAPTEETVPTGNRILRNCSDSPFNAFGTPYAPSEITFIQFVDSHEAIAGISGNDASRDNDHSVFACVVETGEDKILYLYGKGGIKAPEDCSQMFAEYTNLKNISFGNCFDTSNVTNMSGMFQNCSSLEAVDLSGFDTSAVKDMSYMFSGCTSLIAVKASNFETGNLQFANHMFYGAEKLTQVDIPNLDTGRVVDCEEFMPAGGMVNGQPWKQLFTTVDASTPLYGELFFTQDSKELVDSIISRLATEFDIFYEITLIQPTETGEGYTLVPTAENTKERSELEIRTTPVKGGEDIQVVMVISNESAITEDGKVSFSTVMEIYYALMGKTKQEMIDNPPKLSVVNDAPTIMEARLNGLVCDIMFSTDAVMLSFVPEGSIIG